jgi:HEAT repeat protein
VESACRERGEAEVVRGCIGLLSGRDVDAGLVRALGGPGAARFLDSPPQQRYWLRVWGARGLLWVWDSSATPSIVEALADEAWRVREMAAKVVARHLVDDALPGLAVLDNDPVPRVRAAASRALRRLTEQNL